ncbi:hypothetical protein ACFL20_04980 [Spirochaetota bacterium]
MSSINDNPAIIKVIEQDNYVHAFNEASKNISVIDLEEPCSKYGTNYIKEGSVVFGSNISEYLTSEDVAVGIIKKISL